MEFDFIRRVIRLSSQVSPMSALDRLEGLTGSAWPNIHAGRIAAFNMRQRLETELSAYSTQDSSIVIMGSLARQEFTAGSDLDWTLLLDGLSDPGHVDVANEIATKIRMIEGKPPGPEGTFGTFVSSHGLIHHIGGEGDTNSNTTRRILLMLESIAIGRPEARERVLKNVLSRYLAEDRGLWHGGLEYKIPRFLFNDIARYWRTMAVDFAYKQRTRPGGDFALKNFKLRLSRKLIYLAGMIACFECHIGFIDPKQRTAFYSTTQSLQPLIERVYAVLCKPPLEIVASALLRHDNLRGASKQLFDAYDEFLEMLADQDIRSRLANLPLSKLDDPIADRYRGVARRFMDAIEAIFLRGDNTLGELTIKYGVF